MTLGLVPRGGRIGGGSPLSLLIHSSITAFVTVLCPLPECLAETDSIYGLQWGFTAAGETVEQPCGLDFIGRQKLARPPLGPVQVS